MAARWWIVLAVAMAGCSGTATQTPSPTATDTPTLEPTRAPLDRSDYIEDLERGMEVYFDQGLSGAIGLQDDGGDDRTAILHLAIVDAPLEPQILEVFYALAVTIRTYQLDLDAGTVMVWANEDLLLERVTAQVPDLLEWYRDELSDSEFQGRWEVVDRAATRAAQATTSALPSLTP